MRKTARLWMLVSLLTLTLLAPAESASAASDRLPDLAMARLRHIGTTRTADGRRLLRFSAVIVNVGVGPFELRSWRPNTSSKWSVEQVIYNTDGAARTATRPAVRLVYAGDGHDHWHVKDLETYQLAPLPDRGGNHSPNRIGNKVGFCFFDNYQFRLSLRDAPQDPVYGHRGCGTTSSLRLRNGLSVGWGDIYHRSLPGQYIDITDLPNGRYRLSATTNQGNLFQETSTTNNSTWADLRIRTRSVTVLRRAPSP